MLNTYRAVLKGGCLEWRGDRPFSAQEEAVEVHVTVLQEESIPPAPEDQGSRMAAALERLALLPERTTLADPVAWERQAREDRSLPGRETGC